MPEQTYIAAAVGLTSTLPLAAAMFRCGFTPAYEWIFLVCLNMYEMLPPQ